MFVSVQEPFEQFQPMLFLILEHIVQMLADVFTLTQCAVCIVPKALKEQSHENVE